MNAETRKTVLVVAAHPDDEVLGCGGVIARHADAGDRVYPFILAEGATSRGGATGGDETELLQEAARNAARVLGAEPPRFGGLPDNRLDSVPLLDVIKRIEAVVEELEPSIVYTHHGGDLNIDHRIAHQAAVTACRPLPGAAVRTIYAFETVSSTEWASDAIAGAFRPTRFVDISAQLDRKMEALGCYAVEMRPFPHARSKEAVAALARVRGASAGVTAAEAFAVVREVVGEVHAANE